MEGYAKGKIIIVLDVHYDRTQWSLKNVRENLPYWADSAFRQDRGGDDCPYYLDNPTVYTHLADFDADRVDGNDHFAPAQLDLWATGLSAESST